MIAKRRSAILLSSGMITVALLSSAAQPAFADDAKTEELERQIKVMQQQLQSLQHQVAQTKKSSAAAQTPAQAPPPPAAPGTMYLAAPSGAPMPTKGPSPSWWDGIKVSLA